MTRYLCGLRMHFLRRTSLLSTSLLVAVLWIGSGGTACAQEARILILKGDSLLDLEKPQRALEYFDKAIAKDASATSYLARAQAWFVMDRMDRFLMDV